MNLSDIIENVNLIKMYQSSDLIWVFLVPSIILLFYIPSFISLLLKLALFLRTRSWLESEAVIVESYIDKKTSKPVVRYEFCVQGNTHQGDSVGSRKCDSEHAGRLIKNYQVGQKVKSLYDPHNPDNSIVDPRLNGIIGFVVSFLIAATIGYSLAYGFSSVLAFEISQHKELSAEKTSEP